MFGIAISLLFTASGGAPQAADLLSIPFLPLPREMTAEPGSLALKDLGIQIEGGDGAAEREVLEIFTGRLVSPPMRKGPAPNPDGHRILIGRGGTPGDPSPAAEPPEDLEGYTLRISPSGISLRSRSPAGLFWGLQTLKQAVRGAVGEAVGTAGAKTEAAALPCCSIRDWPAVRYRGFSDDITRGPSTTLEYLKREVRLAAEAKLNFLTYYMEHQFAFRSHPEIGPEGGSLTAAELRALVEYARGFHVEIVGNQQSFGHFSNILKYPRYAALAEVPDVIRPGIPETYSLIDDLFGEQMQVLEAKLFNVCCDETWGLGTGPSKAQAEKVGVGRLYADHIRELHRLVQGKYGRRMMMWGDIILQHPEELPRLPKDIVMLTWGYDARADFEDQILPFAQSGFQFFVCPGVSCWGRLVPDFATAETNIRNFVRDGIRHGALGVLNTTWDDSGENLNGWNGPGILLGAECSWSGPASDAAGFDRRAGAVLFGETDGRLGRLLAAVKTLYRLPAAWGLGDGLFWDFQQVRSAPTIEAAQAGAAAFLARALEAEGAAADLVQAAVRGAHEARSLQLAVRRIGHIARRGSALIELGARGPDAAAKAALWDALRAECLDLKDAYSRLWLAENRPYHLDVVRGKSDALADRYAEISKSLRTRGDGAFRIWEIGGRACQAVLDPALAAGGDWADPARLRRAVVSIRAGGAERRDLPVELRWSGEPLGPSPVLFDDASLRQVPAQRFLEEGKEILAWIIPGSIPAGGERRFTVYFGLDAVHAGGAGPAGGAASASGVTVLPEGDGYTIDNGSARLLLKPEGAHIYAWEAKDLGGLDLTIPGETGWAGFLDTGGEGRSAHYGIAVLARGPVLAKFLCRAASAGAPAKTISVWRGMPWVEVFLDRAVSYFWNFDGPDLKFDGPSPGTALFNGGATAPVGPAAGGPGGQQQADRAVWSAKFRAGGRAIALLTPDEPTRHLVGPGGTWGGVGIEGGSPALHFAVWGGKAPDDPSRTFDRLAATLRLAPGAEARRGPPQERR